MNDTYDAGYLPNDEDCDQDSIRVELAYSHDFYSSIIESKNERIAELEKALKAVKKDLLMRAEEDSEGCKVVELSSSVWIQLKEALKVGE